MTGRLTVCCARQESCLRRFRLLSLLLAFGLPAPTGWGETITSPIGEAPLHTADGKSLRRQIFLDIKPETPVEPLNGLTYRANNNRDGVYQAAGVPALQGVRWKFSTGGRVFSNPCSDGRTVYFGSTDQKVYALSLATGALKWAFETKGQVWSSPALYDGILYIGSNDATLYALKADTGEVVWQVKKGQPGEWLLDPGYQSKSGSCSPAVGHGLVFMSLGETVYGFDLKTGTEKWLNLRSGPAQQLAGPLLYQHRIYYGYDHTRMRAWSLITLDEEVSFPEAGNDDMAYTPALWQDRLYYLGHHGYLYGVQARQRARVFKGGEFLIPAGDSRGNKSQGNLGPTDIQFKTEGMSPSVCDGKVVFGCTGGAVVAKDAETGKDAWVFDTGSWVRTPAGIASGVVYIGSTDRNFYALDLKTGALKWKFDAGAAVTSPAWIGNGCVVFGTADGTVYCLE